MLTGREGKPPEEIDSEEGLVSMVDEEYERRRKERRPFEMQWRLNIAFLEGNQFVDVNPAVWEIEEMSKQYWHQEMEAHDQIGPIIEARLARLARMRPVLRARPASNDSDDLFAARIGTALTKQIYDEAKVQEVEAESNNWMEATGTAFLKNIWNPAAGPTIGSVDVDDSMPEEVRTGDLDIAAISSFEIFPDSCYSRNLRDCGSIIHARAYHVDEILEYWNVSVSPESGLTAMQIEPAESGTGGGFGYNAKGFLYKIAEMDDHALVKEYWERPTRVHPRGQLVITANDKLLYYGDLPYKVGDDETFDFPFVRKISIFRPGSFWGRSIIERLIPVQRRYNALRNRKAEYLNRFTIGQFTVEDGSVDLDTFEEKISEPGSLLVYQRGFTRPEPVSLGPLPAAFHQEEQSLLQEFSMLSGVSELSRHSGAPPGVKSGVAMAIALEQDDTRLSLTAENIKKALSESGKQWLRLYKQFVSEDRLLKVVGKNNVVEVLSWSGSSIRSDDVVVEPVSAALDSPAQRRQMVFELLGTGLLNDPESGAIDRETRAKVLEMIELGNWETAGNFDQLQLSRADRENKALRDGQSAIAMNYDDHSLHVNRHTRFRLTVEYESLVRDNPEIHELFEEHMGQHLEFLAPAMGANTPPSSEGTVNIGMPPADPNFEHGVPVSNEEARASAGGASKGQGMPSPIVQMPPTPQGPNAGMPPR